MAESSAKEPQKDPEESALEQRVEMIMGERNADGLTPAKPFHASDQSKGEIDIFSDPKTAPKVSPELLKSIGATPASQSNTDSAIEPSDSDVPAPSHTAETAVDDAATDKAVADIVASEANTVLEAEDASVKKSDQQSKPQSTKSWKRLIKSKWLWLSLALLIIVLGAVPLTRYKLLGLVLKKTIIVNIIDSQTARPVTGATVEIHGASSKTDSSGGVHLKVPVGSNSLHVTKQYFQNYSGAYFVSTRSGQKTSVKLVATGRRVPIKITDKVSGKPLSGVLVSVLDTSAKTDSNGTAIIVLPTKVAIDHATFSLSGYNNGSGNVQVTDQITTANSFALTPAGTIYFLSNLSGKIDVVKSDLAGTNRQTVLAGTGKEDPNTTSLLASRDWKYLVLKAQRDTAQPSLYLIDTTTDKVTNFDNGDAVFSLVGWYGHNFIYDVARNSTPVYTAGHESLKSYNADTKQLNLLDQSQVDGTAVSAAYQGFYNYYILNGLIIYNVQWYTYTSSGSAASLSSKNDSIRGIEASGQGKKDYQTFAADGVGYVSAALYEPQALYYQVYNYSNSLTTFYKFENNAVTTATGIDQTTFNKTYPTFLISPSGSQSFWTELRDGKNTLFVGDSTGASSKQIATLSDYAPYGWYSDKYLLVSKNSSELYIMPVDGLSGTQQPIKITDYYKPAQSYNGYGYGYGGL